MTEDYNKTILNLKAESPKSEERAFKCWSSVEIVKVKLPATSNTLDSGSAAGSSPKLKVSKNVLLSTSLSQTPDVASASDPFTFTTSLVVLQRSVSLFCSAHAQTKLCKEICELESKNVSLSHLKPTGFPTAQNMKELNMARVSYLISDTEKQKKHRTEK